MVLWQVWRTTNSATCYILIVIRVLHAEGKVTTGDKYVLAYHPSRHVAAFQLLGGISLKDFNKGIALIVGCADHSASLLKDDVNPEMDISFAILNAKYGLFISLFLAFHAAIWKTKQSNSNTKFRLD